MKTHKFFVVLFVLLGCSGNQEHTIPQPAGSEPLTCNGCPENFGSFIEAESWIRSHKHQISENALTPTSDWIRNIEYFSCDGQKGFLIIDMQDHDYLFSKIPLSLWQEFKAADSKGEFYHQHIRKKYGYDLKN